MRAWGLIGSSRGFSLLNETELSFPCTYPDSSYSPSILLSRVFLGKRLKRGSRAEHTVYPCIHNVRLQSHFGDVLQHIIRADRIWRGCVLAHHQCPAHRRCADVFNTEFVVFFTCPYRLGAVQAPLLHLLHALQEGKSRNKVNMMTKQRCK